MNNIFRHRSDQSVAKSGGVRLPQNWDGSTGSSENR
eukprot:SAG11_NODE_31118_length_294_cov_1.958974_1_plen_35_part_01